MSNETPKLDLREGYTEKFGFHDADQFVFKSRRGLDREIVAQISDMKGEPAWMRDYRLKALEIFEKKRAEILQMAVLKPEIAIMDETDSGLDIDALRVVADGVKALAGPDLGILVITHYQRILNYIKPDFVHVMVDGRIVLSGGAELALELEARGYDFVREKEEVET